MGDGQIFLKTGRDASFNKDLSMSLISTGSISLDSTFKTKEVITQSTYAITPLPQYHWIYEYIFCHCLHLK